MLLGSRKVWRHHASSEFSDPSFLHSNAGVAKSDSASYLDVEIRKTEFKDPCTNISIAKFSNVPAADALLPAPSSKAEPSKAFLK